MYTTTQQYIDAVRSRSRVEDIVGTVTLTSGTHITLNRSNIPSGGVKLQKQCVTGEELEFGSVILSQLDLSIRTSQSRYAFYGATIRLTYKIKLADNTWYNLALGEYKVSEAEKSGSIVKLTAYDNLQKLDKSYDGTELIGTPYELITAIANVCDLEFTQTQSAIETFPNGDTVIVIDAGSGCSTYRDCVKLITQMLAAFAIANSSGSLEIKKFLAEPVISLTSAHRYSMSAADFIARYATLTVQSSRGEFIASDTSQESGLSMQMSAAAWSYGKNEDLQSRTQNVLDELTTLVYTPCKLEMPGDPSLECGDMLSLIVENSTVNTIITSITWIFRGRMSIESIGKNPYLNSVKTSQQKTNESVQNQLNQKATTFTATPTTPYYKGDLWLNGSDILVCSTTRLNGDIVLTDWAKHDSYVSDTDVDNKIQNNVTSVKVEYYLSTSATQLSGGTWSTVAPTWENGKYMWSRTSTTLKNGNTVTSDPTCISGAQGPSGASGSNGRGIQSITNYYLASDADSGITSSTLGWTTTVQAISESKRYLWNYEVITYSDSTTPTATDPAIIGVWGNTGTAGTDGYGIASVTFDSDKKQTLSVVLSWQNLDNDTWGGVSSFDGKIGDTVFIPITISDYSTSGLMRCIVKQYSGTILTTDNKNFIYGAQGPQGDPGPKGVGISSITEYYSISNSDTVEPSEWQETIPPTMSATNRYLWNYEVILYTDGSTSETSKRVIGTYGATGSSGTSVSSVIAQYYLSKNKVSAPAESDPSWTSTAPAWVSGYYLWVRFYVTYSDGMHTVTTPYCDSSWEAINDLNQLEIFNRLTNNGQEQGIWLEDGIIYINGQYIQANTVKANSLDVSDLFAKNITMEGTLTAISYAYIEPGAEEAQKLYNYILGTENIDDSELPLYDFDGNGSISVLDAVNFYKAATGELTITDMPSAVKSKITITINLTDPNKIITISATNMWNRNIERYIGLNGSLLNTLKGNTNISGTLRIGSALTLYTNDSGNPTLTLGSLSTPKQLSWKDNGDGTFTLIGSSS